MKPVMDYTLYLVTDEALCSAPTLEEGVEQALKGGATLVQLREKETNSRDFYEQALKVKAVCDRYQVPLIIKDRLDIALAVDAAGVHLGQEDLPCAAAKKRSLSRHLPSRDSDTFVLSSTRGIYLLMILRHIRCIPIIKRRRNLSVPTAI